MMGQQTFTFPAESIMDEGSRYHMFFVPHVDVLLQAPPEPPGGVKLIPIRTEVNGGSVTRYCREDAPEWCTGDRDFTFTAEQFAATFGAPTPEPQHSTLPVWLAVLLVAIICCVWIAWKHWPGSK